MNRGAALNLGQREEYHARYNTPHISSVLTSAVPAQDRYRSAPVQIAPRGGSPYRTMAARFCRLSRDGLR
jgi:hypothetical protein